MSTTTLQQVPTGTYTVDPIHSTFGFAVKHNGISLFRGQFEQVDASLKDGVLRGSVQVDSVKTPIADLKGHLLSPDFFDAEQTPTIDFTSKEIRVADDGSVEVDGDLAIRGVSHPVTAPRQLRLRRRAQRRPTLRASTSRRGSTAATTASTGRHRSPAAATPSPGTSASRRTSSS